MTVNAREEVIDMIKRMPDDATVVDIMAELYFRQRVDQGLEQLDAGESLEHGQVKERLKRWLT